jgi:hypothetical protein
VGGAGPEAWYSDAGGVALSLMALGYPNSP